MMAEPNIARNEWFFDVPVGMTLTFELLECNGIQIGDGPELVVPYEKQTFNAVTLEPELDPLVLPRIAHLTLNHRDQTAYRWK